MQDIKQHTERSPVVAKLKAALKGFNKGFVLLLVYELIEEALEELIAWSITTIIAKAVSFLFVVLLTQTTKVTAKAIVILIKPAVKKLTYKKGDDKMQKLIKILKAVVSNIKANWKNYLGIAAIILAAILPFFQEMLDFGIGIQVFGYNIVPFVVIVISWLIGLIGVCVDGTHTNKVWEQMLALKNNIHDEKQKQKAEQLAAKEAEKEEAKIKAEAQAEIEAEEKAKKAEELAQIKAKQDAETARIEAEAKEKAEREHRERVEAYKKQLLAQRQESAACADDAPAQAVLPSIVELNAAIAASSNQVESVPLDSELS